MHNLEALGPTVQVRSQALGVTIYTMCHLHKHSVSATPEAFRKSSKGGGGTSTQKCKRGEELRGGSSKN